MRSEQEMLSLIVDYAKENDRVRAVIMNGSRLNSNAPRDCFQDYDIVYVVTDVNIFVSDRDWIKRFGEPMIMQTPEENGHPPRESYEFFNYLMQFTDGNRIDLNLYSLEAFNQVDKDSLSLLLLDKDGQIEPFPPPSDSDYITRRPSPKQFADCCNEFWWVCPYIAKGLWRGEVLYAKHMFDGPVRDMLIQMLRWHIGVRSGFTLDSGKYGKYFEKQLTPQQWGQLMRTYSDADYEHMWQALFVMADLFRQTAVEVAAHLGYEYLHDDDRRVTAHLEHVRNLPQDAEQMYP
ncbi:aminoglycoside 6-adenylyltransferase [Paenibacillus sedimenti]|uniref:Aminoglycoside 6-adenylyltransferase n=1 Tax=Paenibacillus sedimenti TaxID=2770274 RepID=A0A926KUC4_9BACL|nr:aminoglycoside 6-adenylyltransferase [Paenibacillus sedimenti]MBD0383692.1 aminoglycoside 6-adenylyltransferase [Paenibacillus sedimenti]